MRILSYAAAISRLKYFDKFGSKPGLSRMKKLLNLLGNPERNYKTVIVGGTNGKGSTTEMLSSILQKAGFRTGSYFSPPVFDFCERMLLNGKMAEKKDVAACLSETFEAAKDGSFLSDPPSFFEIVTSAALLYFARKRVDYAVLEVGLGGRLDATNACGAELSIITSIGLEHTEILGRTLDKIAFEKAGIAKKGKPLICADLPPRAFRMVRLVCQIKGARLTCPLLRDKKMAEGANLRLLGAYQISNASLAACAARHLGIGKNPILTGLSHASLPARIQVISRNPLLILDSAHNPPAAYALSRELPSILRNRAPAVLLFSAMSNKKYPEVLSILSPHFSHAVVFSPPLERAESVGRLLACAKKCGYRAVSAKNPKGALRTAKKIAGKSGAILACGSMYSFSYLFGNGTGGFAQ